MATVDDLASRRDVEQEAQTRLDIQHVLDAIATLPVTLSEPLRLQLLDGLNASQIATLLGIAPEAARQRLSRARQFIRSKLD